ncbi:MULTISPECIES: hypothetical protein [Streptomyces]|uniref:Uncharacterized protein n=1 Tax=Streptomyces similanensis TaxID=1274988 RepID=A0ABP9L983_9ACTN|nr:MULTISPECIES: hypothetical protein [Streptomyces]MYS39710.1 hypothetical protein [Streptomyces sp. SID5998]MYX47313.1 hypothetical protein [Streptomyces sp. SID89]NED77152.1 hypothetical protein [Streptomyces sp. SID9944]QKW27594.1 hypothetical protein HUT11_16800 [Streptomyces seoulensis]EFF91097.1 hypothetical protein SSTG_01415 [Streptomyces sp. e14]
MKSLKAAAIVAGSLIAASVGGPAFAADVASAGFSGHLNSKLPVEVAPLDHQSDVIHTGTSGSLVETAREAANSLNDARPLHHTTKDATTALQDAKPMHGDLAL